MELTARNGVISGVIPVLNEEADLAATVKHLRAIPEIGEIIVVDGGSVDETRALAERLGCQVVISPPGRGGQLRRGAELARCEVVLFVHADTWLPPEAGRAALEVLAENGVVGGGYWKRFRDPSWLMWGAHFRCWARMVLWRRVLGDQGMFVRKAALERVGGVPNLPLMEEFELCRRLRAIGSLRLARATVTTSARRFRKHGVLKTYWIMGWVTLRYWMGARPDDLARTYQRATE